MREIHHLINYNSQNFNAEFFRLLGGRRGIGIFPFWKDKEFKGVKLFNVYPQVETNIVSAHARSRRCNAQNS